MILWQKKNLENKYLTLFTITNKPIGEVKIVKILGIFIDKRLFFLIILKIISIEKVYSCILQSVKFFVNKNYVGDILFQCLLHY